MKRILVIVSLWGALALGAGSAYAQGPAKPTTVLADAQVVSIKDTGKVNPQNKAKVTTVQLEILSGKYAGKLYGFEDNAVALQHRITYKPGDRVVATISETGKGDPMVYISDYDRKPQLLVLFLLFVGVTIAIARKQAIMSIVAMLISIYVIAQIIIPSILAGTNAFTITMIGALIMIPSTYYLSHGFNKKTTIAVVATFITLAIVVALSHFFTTWSKLSGFESEEAAFLQMSYGSSINILSLLLAGMLIGALAVLDDITISQASIVASLRKSNERLSKKQLYKHAMNVGRDHVASLVNTFILVYVGASFPLVLLFYNTQTPVSLILNQEIIATEIVRTLISSIGIILAVPITTYIACRWGE